MRIRKCGPLIGALALVAVAGSASAGSDGLVLRAVGFYKGLASISQNAGQATITCQIPTVSTAIADGSFAIGIWNTQGFATLFFPDPNNPFGNPCGGWVQLRSALLNQGITLDTVDIRFRIPGARRFRDVVPTRRQFPTACKPFRHAQIFAGIRLDPTGGSDVSSGSGAANTAFLQLLPLVSSDLIQCLREQYATLPTATLVSIPLVARVVVTGISDAGDTYQSNPISYTLNMRHTCGNGRVDDGEQCDLSSGINTCLGGICTNNSCTLSHTPCATNNDCVGTCTAPGTTTECSCIF